MTSKEAEAKGGHVAQAEQARPVPAAPAQADAVQAGPVQAGPVQVGVGHAGAGQAGAGQEPDLAGLYPADRLGLAAAAAARAGIGALLLTPGPDLRYLTGYDALATERLTCLAVPADGPAFLVAPRLELRSVRASPAGGLGLDIVAWDEAVDPYRLVAGRLGRTEREVAADIGGAIIAEGHARADFVIVGSGPNAARPHHEPSGRILAAGDTVVVDIGGTMPSGYCSDCTRTYAIGSPPPEVT